MGRPFLSLVADPDNGIAVDGKPFHFPRKLLKRFDAVTKSLLKHGSFKRPFPLFTECVSSAQPTPRCATRLR